MMKVKEFANKNNYRILAGEKGLEKEIKNVYICDLLSWVMAHARKNDAWITIQTNINIVAVALLTEVACVIIPEGVEVENKTLEKANEQGIPILSSEKSAYDITIELYKNI